MLRTTSHWGSANQNYKEISPCPHYDGYCQKQNKHVGKHVEKWELLRTAGGNAKGAAASENSMEVSQKIKTSTA